MIIPSVRAIIRDRDQRILYIQRRGNGQWALPAGGIELNESIFECLQREVAEETGLHVIQATLIAMYTGRPYRITNSYGDQYQGVELLFRVDEWEGALREQTDETTNIDFFAIDDLPSFEPGYFAAHEQEVLNDLRSYNGTTIIK